MNFFKKFQSDKRQLIKFYFKTLADISMYTGIHSWDFTGPWPIYKPQESLVNFFLKILQKTSILGLTNSKMTKELNRWNVQNLLCAEDRPWTELDTSRILSAKEGGLIVIN